MKTSHLLLIVFVIAGLSPLKSQIVADSITSNYKLINNPEVKAVATRVDLTVDEVEKMDSWLPYDTTFKTNSKTAVWLRFELENRSEDSIVNFVYSKDQYVTTYIQDRDGYKVFKNGTLFKLNERTNQSEYDFTKLSLAPFQKSLLYIRLNTSSTKSVLRPPILYSELDYWSFSQSIRESQSSSIGFIYFYIISLITILTFAIVFWLRLWKKLYLYYLGYLFFQIIYGLQVLRVTGATVGNVFAFIPELSTHCFQPVQFIFIGFYILFIKHLLAVKNYDILLAKILSYLGGFCFIYAISHFIFSYFFYGNMFSETLFIVVRSLIIPLNFVLIFWIIYKVKHPLIVYFIVGQTFFFIGAVLSTYVAYTEINLLEGNFFNFVQSPNIIFQIGLLAEVFCFSLALGENVFLLQRDKAKTNKDLIAQLKENQFLQESMNRELDEKVRKKTEELIKLYSEIERDKEQKIKNEFTQKIRETEMVALRSQMNPHFIFNSLNAIKHLIINSRNDDAIVYLDDFSSLLRGILQNSKRQQITVEEELEVLELYLSLERSRMGADFSYTIEAPTKEVLSQYPKITNLADYS